jgi:hypothetical protein
LEAAALVTFDVLDPVLRSRGAVLKDARTLYGDEAFRADMQALFNGEPTGRLIIPTLQDALERIEALERQLADVTRRLALLEQSVGM